MSFVKAGRDGLINKGCLMLLLGLSLVKFCQANSDARRLFDDLLMKGNYNKLVRPVENSSDKVKVELGLKLTQLIDVDEKNEIVSTNVWLVQDWEDHRLRWNPVEYGGVSNLYVPSTDIWLPDIVLSNNADGDFTVALMTKATLTWYGKVHWEPPAIYKFWCDIKVQYFPFDKQYCWLKFISWSYDAFKVDLNHIWRESYGTDEEVVITVGMALEDYYPSQEWDLLEVPAKKNFKKYTCCPEPYIDITFNMTLRRKTQYYTVNLIIPLSALNMLVLLCFYLPCDSCEKISICISILLSLSLFQLLLMEIVPATSTSTSLLGTYIVFTTAVVSLSVFCSVMVLNVKHKTASTHEMSRLTKMLFLELLPKVLFMKRPYVEEEEEDTYEFEAGQSDLAGYQNPYKRRLTPVYPSFKSNREQPLLDGTGTVFCEACAKQRLSRYPPNAQKGYSSLQFIAKHMKDDDDGKTVKEDWLYVAMVIDRILLWIYVTMCLVGTCGVLMNAPALYDDTPVIGLPSKAPPTPSTPHYLNF